MSLGRTGCHPILELCCVEEIRWLPSSSREGQMKVTGRLTSIQNLRKRILSNHPLSTSGMGYGGSSNQQAQQRLEDAKHRKGD